MEDREAAQRFRYAATRPGSFFNTGGESVLLIIPDTEEAIFVAFD
jgi:hypothetical protein